MNGPTTIYDQDGIEVTQVVVGPLANNVFIVRCQRSGEALLVDAADEHELLLPLCERLGVRRVVETHGHWDHIGAVEAVRDAGIEVAVTAADAAMLPSYDAILDDDEVVQVGHVVVRTIATPGHTPGSMCFRIEGTPLLLSGDTLFHGGPGATHFPGGDFPTILRSIEERLLTPFAKDTIVMPGHGEFTTIGSEADTFEDWVRRGW